MLIAAACAALAAWLAWPAGPGVAASSTPSRIAGRMLRAIRRRPRMPPTAPALGALAAELAAGAMPDAALLAATSARECWPTAVAAARTGGDVAAAFELDGAWALAACWRIAGAQGAGLSRAIAALAAQERDGEAVRAQLAAELAAPRASARMLAALPLVGLAMGVLMGADPIGFLLTGAGLVCLAAAVALTVVGLAWSGRSVRAIERQL